LFLHVQTSFDVKKQFWFKLISRASRAEVHFGITDPLLPVWDHREQKWHCVLPLKWRWREHGLSQWLSG
jgi:hypothetical protein